MAHLCPMRHKKAEDHARRHGVGRVDDTAQALIEDPEVDAVDVVTPPGRDGGALGVLSRGAMVAGDTSTGATVDMTTKRH